jgi:N-acetyl-anhydromuramyl-L-alanine amidase AmpD
MSSKILDDMRDVMRRRHYSIRTERSYCEWVKRFVLHFNMKSRDDLTKGEKEIETYLTFLARDREVAYFSQTVG